MMFSSFSFSQLSPKTLLANYLSRQLADFFDVDPQSIESNLVSSTHVKLRSVRIRPYILETSTTTAASASSSAASVVVCCEGTVDSIEFKWEWGSGFGEGAKAYIKDVQLHVGGVKLRLYEQQQSNSSNSDNTYSVTSNSSPAEAAVATSDPDWKAQYLQQIVDHLTVVLDSIEITVELPPSHREGGHSNNDNSSSSSLRVIANKIELMTLGGASSVATTPTTTTTTTTAGDGLRQRLTLGSLTAMILQTTDGGKITKELPLLDPVGYRATVKRISGRRFLDGLGAGLIISGDRIMSGVGNSSSSNTISSTQSSAAIINSLQVYAGMEQVACLQQLQKMFGFDAANNSSSTVPNNGTTATTLSENQSSLFVLPVEFLSLVLHNGTTIRIDDCVVTLRTDGSVCLVENPNGNLSVDGQRINHTQTGSWIVDLLRSNIVIEPSASSSTAVAASAEDETFYESSQEEDALMKLELDVNQCQKIYKGFMDIMDLFETPEPHYAVTPWKFEVPGRASMCLISAKGTKAMCDLKNTRIQYIGSQERDPAGPSGLPCLYSWDSISISAPGLGNFLATIPQNNAGVDGLFMSFSNKIALEVDTLDAADKVVQFVKEFANIFEGESTGVPLAITVPGILMHIRNDHIDAKLENVAVSGFDMSSSGAAVSSDQASLLTRKLTCNLDNNSAYIEEVTSACFNNSVSLSAPLKDLSLQYIKEKLVVSTTRVEILHKESPDLQSNDIEEAFPWGLELPIPIEISLEDMSIYEDSVSNVLFRLLFGKITAGTVNGQSSADLSWKSCSGHGFKALGGNCHLVLSGMSLGGDLHLDSLRYDDSTVGGFVAKTIQFNGKLRQSAGNEKSIEISHFGFLDEASISIGSVQSLSVKGTASLAQPLLGTNIKLIDGELDVSCGHACIVLSDESSPPPSGDGEVLAAMKFQLPVPVHIAFSEVIMGKASDTSVHSLKIEGIHCNAYTVGEENSLSLGWKKLKLMDFEVSEGEAKILSLDKVVKASAEFSRVISMNWIEGKVLATGVRAAAKFAASPRSNRSYKIDKVGFLEEACLSLTTMSTLSLFGTYSLSSPLDRCLISFADDSCVVELGNLNIAVCTPQTITDTTEKSTRDNFIQQVPFPVKLSSSSITLCGAHESLKAIRIDRIEIDARPDGVSTLATCTCPAFQIDELSGTCARAHLRFSSSTIHAAISCESVYGTNFQGVDLSLKSPQISSLVDLSSERQDRCGLVLGDGMVLRDGTFTLQEIASLSIRGSGYLASPLLRTSIVFHNDSCKIDVADFSWFQPEGSPPSQSPIDFESILTKATIPCLVNLSIRSISVYNTHEINPILHWDQVVAHAESTAGVTGGKIKWDRARLYTSNTAGTEIETSIQGSKIRLKAECATVTTHEPGNFELSAVSVSISASINTSASSIMLGLPVGGLGCISNLQASVQKVNSLVIPGTGCLLSPLTRASISFINGAGEVNVGDVHWKHLQSGNEAAIGSFEEYKEYFGTPYQLCIQSLRLEEDGSTVSPMASFTGLKLKTEIIQPDTFLVPFSICHIQDIQYLNLIKIPELQLQACVDLRHPQVLHFLEIALKTVHLTADFKSIQWSDALATPKDSSPPVPLPFAKVSEFDLILNGKGKVVAIKNAILHCSHFQGNQMTNSEEMTQHYVRLVKKRIPYLLSTSEVLGANVGDSVSAVAARAAMNSTVVGAVAGVGVRDAIGGSISLGKQSRGAAASERYHFGDMTRGLVAASKLTAQRGSSKRGSDKYAVGDFTSGAASATAEYSSRNRDRLGGAAGSGAAMIAGAAIAGPIGLVAGSIIGGMAGRRAVHSTVGEYQEKRPISSTTQASRPDDTSNTNGSVQAASSTRTSYLPRTEVQNVSTVNNSGAGPATPAGLQPNSHPLEGMQSRPSSDPFAIFETQQITPNQVPGPTSPLDRPRSTTNNMDPFSVFEEQQPSSTHAPTNVAPSNADIDFFSAVDRQERTTVAGEYQGFQPQHQASSSQHIPVAQQGHQVPPVTTASGHDVMRQQQQVPQHQLRSYTSATPSQQTNRHSTAYLEQNEMIRQQQQQQQQPIAQHQPHSMTVTQQRQQPSSVAVSTGQLGQQQQQQYQHYATSPPVAQSSTPNQNPTQQSGYRFGDLTRSVVAKGKDKRGANSGSNYKFGDFTRGLFSK